MRWTWCRLCPRGVHFAAQDVSVLAAAIRREPWGRKQSTSASVIPGSRCLHLYFLKTDFVTGFFFYVSLHLISWLISSSPCSTWFLYSQTVNPTPRKLLQEIIVWGTNFGGKPGKSYHGRSFSAVASGCKYLNKSSPWLPSNASVAWTKLIFISPFRMLAPPRNKTEIGPKRCFQLSLFIRKLHIIRLWESENMTQTKLFVP